jgi:hypothetical protein
MDRLSGGSPAAPGVARLRGVLAGVAWRAGHAVRAFSRRWGIWGWALSGCAALAAASWAVDASARREAASLRTRIALHAGLVSPGAGRPAAPAENGDRARLQAFDKVLLAHEDIPDVVQDVLNLAARHGLEVRRGQYRGQPDTIGAFFRYRMTLPVKGAPAAVYGFMQEALRAQPALALESVQFRRERGESPEIELNLHWLLLARLPAGAHAEGEAQAMPEAAP